MSKKKYEVVAVTGKYTDNEGNEKSRYQNIGVILETKNGHMLKLEAVPVGWDGWAYLNEPREREQSGGTSRGSSRPARQATSAKPSAEMEEDSIPFITSRGIW